MIDYDKEKEEFIKLYTEIYGEHDQLWQGWKARAELAQAEINKEREQATEYYTDCEYFLHRLNDLKQKLARYENPDYVLFSHNINDESIKPIDASIEYIRNTHNAMIEAMEKENAQQDS